MFTHATQAHVVGLTAQAAYDFLLNAGDQEFSAWWPGVHLTYRTLRSYPNHIGNVMVLDQFIGDYRVREKERIVEAVPYRRIVRQIIKIVPVPVRIVFDFEEDDHGLTITHTIRAGISGIGRILDPIFRCFLRPRFLAALDEHLLTEFQLLREPALSFAAARLRSDAGVR